MPPGSPTQPQTENRRNITSVIARHNASRVDVCCAGGRVAIHFATQRGVVVIETSEKAFTQGCRGKVDYNGRCFRSLEEIAKAAVAAVAPESAREMSGRSQTSVIA